MPQAFSPNGDGINDEAKIGGKNFRELLEFNVYNRWGQLIFSTDDINKGWDGTFNGRLQTPEVYIYKIRAISNDGEIVSTEGYLNLIR